ncbi:serine protease [Streptomyces goshikiensis]|uniref:serine protease n=1 Tax=Streptomyces goshikiensis TaxID=1942 RepID=UPI0036ABB31C
MAFTVMASPANAVTGGQTAAPGQFPYTLALLNNGTYVCGATLIGPSKAITAAHCVDGLFAGQLTVRANSLQPTSGGQTQRLSQVVIHPSYSSFDLGDDIAVLRLAGPLPAVDVPALLPPQGPPPSGRAFVVGYGANNPGGTFPNPRSKVSVQLISNPTCQEAYGSEVTDGMVCGGAAGKGACTGDDGGPVAGPLGLTVLGIISWGATATPGSQSCGSPGQPDVYTNVSSYTNWINNV